LGIALLHNPSAAGDLVRPLLHLATACRGALSRRGHAVDRDVVISAGVRSVRAGVHRAAAGHAASGEGLVGEIFLG